MTELLKTTVAYRTLSADAARGSLSHAVLVLFPDEKLLRTLLKTCAKVYFGEDARKSEFIDKESFFDCLVLPAAEEKFTVDTAARVIEESCFSPVESEKKLFVLDAFHTSTPLVQNKLLKILEEPPKGVYFLLGATAEHAILPTVLSRVKKISVPPFSEEAIYDALCRHHVREEGLREAAEASGGIYSAAEEMLSGGGEEFRLARQFLAGEDVEELCKGIGERKDKLFFAALETVLRDLALIGAGAAEERRTPETDRLMKDLPLAVILKAIGEAARAEREIRFNANPGQAAYALYLKIGEEKAKWQTL